MSDVHVRELERRWVSTRAVSDEVALVSARLRAGTITRDRVELAAHCGHPAAIELLGARAQPVEPHGAEWARALARFGAEAVLRFEAALVSRLRPADDRVVEDLVAAVEDRVAADSAGLDTSAPIRALIESYPEVAPSVQAAAIDELVRWALGHDDPLHARVTARAALREAALGRTAAPPLVASPLAAAALKSAEARAKVRPRDLATLVELVHRSEQAGWTLDGRPISELRAALADSSGTLDEDRRLVALLAPLGPRAVPLAIDALQRHGSRVAFLLLESLGPGAAAAVPALLELLAHADGSVRIRAGQVLAAIGKPAISPLRLRLPELSHPGAAVFALLALGEGSWPLEAPMLHAFNQNDEAVWSLLFELRRPGALAPAAPALRALVASPLSTISVRRQCQAWLSEL